MKKASSISKEDRKMKRILLVITLFLGVVALFAVSAQATVYTDFNSMVSANGTYFAGPPAYEALSYASPDKDAVVGVKGPLGTLSTLNMSFTYSNPVGTGNAPFAAFGVSVDGLWGTSAYRYNIISMNGNQLNGTSLVHVWDWNLNGGAGGDVAGLGQTDNKTLGDVLSVLNSYNNVAFGNLEVMRAYAYIGDTGSASSGSVDINSITVNNVPLPGTVVLLGSGLAGLGFWRMRRQATAKS
jgi:hypothetical protein